MDAALIYDQSRNLLEGRSVAKDEKRSFELNVQAAAVGHRDAVLAMGWYYLHGVGVERDVVRAKEWYRKAARHRDARAMFSLGQLAYSEGAPQEAITWFQRASEEGHGRSLYWMGKLYWRGEGVNRNCRMAEILLQRAAAQKNREAMRLLRFMSWKRRKRR